MIRIPVLRPGVCEPFPPADSALREPDGLLAAGGDLAPERLLDAYRHGIFPWFSEGQPILWWSPDPRTVFATDRIHVPARLRRWLQHSDWTLRSDGDFVGVVRACAAPRARQQTTWITAEMCDAYCRLHELGFAHSVEAYNPSGRLVGGIYGVAIGRMFFGESMFSAATNGSKVALMALCRVLHAWGFRLLDAQLPSPHLARLGAFAMPRAAFLAHVATACTEPFPAGSWRKRWPALATRELAT
ncbi:MAG: leucyl/phenylalanyl-tRNA--protein transferase [Xanthomonadaceae bacterium]|nr:leucyl/phenylalanyl-tRNA--protein transferase [Xanthomonadaceae bacterium]MDE2084659.1 leucyl/phenylalanyl-tRNA--protein transferase [Xanthomonadaceae bacterium]MDE2258095.1 leucyl/phenylalanyl-tRNA--protein transferase [Xanthomonadaceae bacterium]